MNKLKWYFCKVFYNKNLRKYITSQYEYIMGKKIDIDNPITYNEKIQWFKLNVRNELVTQCSDKIAVREYIKKKGYENILTKLYGIYKSVDEINFDDLPEKFVMKTNNGSGGVIVCQDKSKLDINKTRKHFRKYIKRAYYSFFKEWQYRDIEPKILVEELIVTKSKMLSDYKFFCFNGMCKCIYVAQGTTSGEDDYVMDFYDENFKKLDVGRIEHRTSGGQKAPENFEEMKKIAEDLSRDFPHVRVDLYSENGKIYFGELTFTTCSGFNMFTDESFDKYLGDFYNIKLWK